MLGWRKSKERSISVNKVGVEEEAVAVDMVREHVIDAQGGPCGERGYFQKTFLNLPWSMVINNLF